LYNNSILGENTLRYGSCSNLARNIICFINEFRKHIVTDSNKDVYALLVFDTVLIELGGLFQHSSFNKINNPSIALKLGDAIAEWVKNCVPIASK
jgi:hypothetical protein